VVAESNVGSIGDEQTLPSIFKFHGGFDGPPGTLIPEDATGGALEAALPHLSHESLDLFCFRRFSLSSVMQDAKGLDLGAHEISHHCGAVETTGASLHDTHSMVFTRAANSP
jgi:hypothetical protein